MINYWPPFLGAGIRVTWAPGGNRLAVDVELKLTAWNRNYVGTQFGGSLYAMCDPFFMLLLMENLGSDYVVWDKAATIRFKKPGRGKVSAHFEVSPEQLRDLRERLKTEPKLEPEFAAKITDEEGQVIAEVTKLLYVRRKPALNEAGEK